MLLIWAIPQFVSAMDEENDDTALVNASNSVHRYSV
jgi:hypothetical protein